MESVVLATRLTSTLWPITIEEFGTAYHQSSVQGADVAARNSKRLAPLYGGFFDRYGLAHRQGRRFPHRYGHVDPNEILGFPLSSP